MQSIGVRELKTHASELVEQVRQHGKRYQVTRHGKPVALLVPLRNGHDGIPGDESVAADDGVWAEMDTLVAEIGQRWPGAGGAVEALSIDRR